MSESVEIWEVVKETVPVRFHRLIANYGIATEEEGLAVGRSEAVVVEPVVEDTVVDEPELKLSEDADVTVDEVKEG